MSVEGITYTHSSQKIGKSRKVPLMLASESVPQSIMKDKIMKIDDDCDRFDSADYYKNIDDKKRQELIGELILLQQASTMEGRDSPRSESSRFLKRIHPDGFDSAEYFIRKERKDRELQENMQKIKDEEDHIAWKIEKWAKKNPLVSHLIFLSPDKFSSDEYFNRRDKD